MKKVNTCGLFCEECSYYQQMCPGCRATMGKSFYNKNGCPIHFCAKEHQFETCASCQKLVCEIWKNTRDPRLDNEAFAKDIEKRLKNLKEQA